MRRECFNLNENTMISIMTPKIGAEIHVAVLYNMFPRVTPDNWEIEELHTVYSPMEAYGLIERTLKPKYM